MPENNDNSLTVSTILYPDEAYCQNGQFMLKLQQQAVPFRFFNITLHTDGYQRACMLLEEATQIRLETDDVRDESMLVGWLFADEVLVQQKLIDEEVAEVARHNPYYRYQLVTETEAVHAMMIPQPDTQQVQYCRTDGYIILGLLGFFWMITFVSLNWKRINTFYQKRGNIQSFFMSKLHHKD